MGKYHSNGSSMTWAAGGAAAVVAYVQSLDGPGPESQFYDATALDSDNLIEDGELSQQTAPGEFSATVFFDPGNTVHAAIQAKVVEDDRGYETVVITAPDGSSTITCVGATKSWKPKAGAKDPYMADWSFKNRVLPVYA